MQAEQIATALGFRSSAKGDTADASVDFTQNSFGMFLKRGRGTFRHLRNRIVAAATILGVTFWKPGPGTVGGTCTGSDAGDGDD